jgi:hypothetical protein
MIGDAGEDVGEPFLGIEVGELGGPNEDVNQRRSLRPALRSGEQPRLPAERQAGQGAFARSSRERKVP